jgi:hypothetical protein
MTLSEINIRPSDFAAIRWSCIMGNRTIKKINIYVRGEKIDSVGSVGVAELYYKRFLKGEL